MKVYLQADWFAPDDILYRTKDSPVEIKDSLLEYLPSTAEYKGKKKIQTKVEKAKADQDALIKEQQEELELLRAKLLAQQENNKQT